MANSVQLLPNDTIYAVRDGVQTEASIIELCTQISELAARLRRAAKPVLILSDITEELPMSELVEALVIELGAKLDFDKCAFFPASGQFKSVQDVKVRINGFDLKIQNFASKEAATEWLESFRYASGVGSTQATQNL